MSKNEKNPAVLPFEEAMDSLEDSVRALEGGSLSLEDSLREFEKAIALVRQCSERLEEAKQKVILLTENQDGSVSESPFPGIKDEA